MSVLHHTLPVKAIVMTVEGWLPQLTSCRLVSMACGLSVAQPCCQRCSDVTFPIQIQCWVAPFWCWSSLSLPVSVSLAHKWQVYLSVVELHPNPSWIHPPGWCGLPLGQSKPELGSWLALSWWLQMPPSVWTPGTIVCHFSRVSSMVLPPCESLEYCFRYFTTPLMLSCSFLDCSASIFLMALTILWLMPMPSGVSSYPKTLHSFVLNSMLSGLNLKLSFQTVSSKPRTATSWLVLLSTLPIYIICYLCSPGYCFDDCI